MSRKAWAMLTAALLLLAAGVYAWTLPPSPPQAATGAEQERKPRTTLRLLQFKVEIREQVLAMAEDYMREHPDIVIEAQVLKDYDTTLITRFAAGEAPDIFTVKSYSDIQDWAPRLADLSGEPWMEQISPAAVQGMTVDDRKLGFPMSIEGYGFIYNKELFAQAGIKEVPRTLGQLRTVNEKLKAAGIRSYAEGYKEWWILGQHLLNLPFAYEENPVSAIQSLNQGTRQLGELKYMDGFFDVLDMTVKYGQGSRSTLISYDDQVANFAAGRSAMMQQGVWTMETIGRINREQHIGMFAIPLSENAEETALPVGVPGYYVLNQNSPHLEESKQFLAWLHQNGDKYLVQSFNSIPAFTDLTADNLGPLAADLADYVRRGQTIPWAHALWPSGSQTELAKPLQDYVGGGVSREETLQRLQQVWDTQARLSGNGETVEGP
ncbi:carbohydrate ABC transporter substrate-binding protein [Paenibacillus sp. F411]|uniref:ABC transporter substrate-binding protein n=1 Tax=Paenibacillus sp. F411 TaxID=2820239 RepID=UPI001AAE7451|nr:ABC transporter substrate-binding protein [Paenibacillus sp. F411]MBO2944599.1 carbohydrate ABC transporter substrate-binding protein [Paenibacillus sp. F411]